MWQRSLVRSDDWYSVWNSSKFSLRDAYQLFRVASQANGRWSVTYRDHQCGSEIFIIRSRHRLDSRRGHWYPDHLVFLSRSQLSNVFPKRLESWSLCIKEIYFFALIHLCMKLTLSLERASVIDDTTKIEYLESTNLSFFHRRSVERWPAIRRDHRIA